MLNKIKHFLHFLLLNIHTIFLIVGIAFIVVAAFLWHEVVGYLVLGIWFIVISKLIDSSV